MPPRLMYMVVLVLLLSVVSAKRQKRLNEEEKEERLVMVPITFELSDEQWNEKLRDERCMDFDDLEARINELVEAATNPVFDQCFNISFSRSKRNTVTVNFVANLLDQKTMDLNTKRSLQKNYRTSKPAGAFFIALKRAAKSTDLNIRNLKAFSRKRSLGEMCKRNEECGGIGVSCISGLCSCPLSTKRSYQSRLQKCVQETLKRSLKMNFPQVEWNEELADESSSSYIRMRKMVVEMMAGAGMTKPSRIRFIEGFSGSTATEVEMQITNPETSKEKRAVISNDMAIAAIQDVAKIMGYVVKSDKETVTLRVKMRVPSMTTEEDAAISSKTIEKRLTTMAEKARIPKVLQLDYIKLERSEDNGMTGIAELRIQNPAANARTKRSSEVDDVLVSLEDAVKKAGGDQISGVEMELAEVNLEGFCSDDDNLCNTTHAMCTNSICQCGPGFVQNKRELTKCYERKMFGFMCDVSAQCDVTQTCDRSCQCASEKVAIHTRAAVICAPESSLEKRCRFTEQCRRIKNSLCTGGKCECLLGFTAINNTCIGEEPYETTEAPLYGSTRYGSTEGMTYGSTEGTVYGSTRYGSTEGMTYGSTEGTVYGSTESILYGSTEGVTYGSTEGTVYGSTESILYGSTEGVTYGSSEYPVYGSTEETMYGSTGEHEVPDINIPDCGMETSGNNAPWVVRIETTYASEDEELTTVCAGSIVTDMFVLTAAHCVDRWLDYGNSSYQRNLIKLHFGNEGESSATIYSTYDVMIHPSYKPKGYDFDIAVLMLSAPLRLVKGSVWPICVPTFDMMYMSVDGLQVDVLDFVSTPEGTVNKQPKKTSYSVSDYETCNQQNPEYGLTERMMCAGVTAIATPYHTRSTTGSRKSGGPLVWRNGNGKMIQVGLVSFSIKNEEEGCSGSPDVNVNLLEYVGWLAQIITFTRPVYPV